MKMNKISVVAFSILSICIYPLHIHAAYGGWWWGWWWGSSFKTTVSVLNRDVCPNWDSSWSFFDGACSKETHSVASDKKPILNILNDKNLDLKKLVTTLSKQKNNKLTNQLTNKKMVSKKMLSAQVKIDTIMNRREKLSKEEKEIKVYKLLNVTNQLSENEKIKGDLLMIIAYVHQKSLSMAKILVDWK
jgi:hypothetical protein